MVGKHKMRREVTCLWRNNDTSWTQVYTPLRAPWGPGSMEGGGKNPHVPIFILGETRALGLLLSTSVFPTAAKEDWLKGKVRGWTRAPTVSFSKAPVKSVQCSWSVLLKNKTLTAVGNSGRVPSVDGELWGIPKTGSSWNLAERENKAKKNQLKMPEIVVCSLQGALRKLS